MDALLSPHAVPHKGRLGRIHPEEEDTMRTPFQRDRDRIIHTQAFRRLQGKTQVFVVGQGDHYRTRLTHTMEVAQIGRDIARTLHLNEDLVECIALAHDLGHPPFGHSGEEALDHWMRRYGSSFEHNIQSHRIVTLLETHARTFPGLNLNREVLEGLLKEGGGMDPLSGVSAEATLVNIADEIAYVGHDCDDGLAENLFAIEEVTEIPLAKEAEALRSQRGTSLRGALIHLLVTDLCNTSREGTITFSPTMRRNLDTLHTFLHTRMYLHPRIISPAQEGREIIVALCERFRKDPPAKVLELQARTGGTLTEAVKDYVAGMTDAFATRQMQSKATGVH